MHRLEPDAAEELADVQRPGGLHVEGCADAAGGQVGAAGLVHLDRRDRLGREVGEIERARVGGAAAARAKVGRRHLPAVEQHQVVVRADAAHGDLGAFAAAGAVDRHAADALERFGQVGVGELADVLGDDAVDHALGVALEVHGRGQAGADAGDHDGIQFADVIPSIHLLGDGMGGGRGQRDQQRRGQQAPARQAVCVRTLHGSFLLSARWMRRRGAPDGPDLDGA
jgi:hypothetical protein